MLEYSDLKDTDFGVLEKPSDVFMFLSSRFTKPNKTIFEKKGRGIYRRVVHWVPRTGVGRINRRIVRAKTMDGSKPYRQFIDIGEPGTIRIRMLSCHKCKDCYDGTPSKECEAASECV